MATNETQKKKLSLSAQIMIGMGFGLVVGIFLGEYCAFLQIIGDAFIKLLQITILPYNNIVPAVVLFSILMGDDVEKRRAFIQEHALEVRNLDI